MVAIAVPGEKRFVVQDIDTGLELLSMAGEVYVATVFRPGKRVLVVGTYDGKLQVWSLESKSALRR